MQEFNKGIFDYLIATDDPAKREEHADLNERAEAKADAALPQKGKKRKGTEAEKQQQQQRKRTKKAEQDGEFGVIRGIDFKGVRTVINMDAPDTVQVCNTGIFVPQRLCAYWCQSKYDLYKNAEGLVMFQSLIVSKSFAAASLLVRHEMR